MDVLFKNPKSNFKIAIVVDIWITGFDVPCLDTMYIDKPLQQHTLVQTISRVNRVYPGKDKGLVVDYIGIKNTMNKALKPEHKALITKDMKRVRPLDTKKDMQKVKTMVIITAIT